MIVLDAKFDGVSMIVDGESFQEIPDSLLMCLGQKPSTGKMLISENSAIYIADTQPDLSEVKELISSLADLTATIAETAASQGNPLNMAAAQQVRALKTQLDGFKLI